MGAGRPTKFKKSFIKQMEDYFDVEANELKEIVTTGKNDFQKIDLKEFAANLPTVQGFCRLIGVDRTTFYAWLDEGKSKDYKSEDKEDKKEFSHTYNVCKEIQEQIWQENSLKGLYNAQFAIFMGKNVFGWKDKSEIENSGSITTKVTVGLPEEDEE